MRFRLSRRIKINVPWFLNMVTALFLILNCQSVWQRSYNYNYHVYECCFLIVIINCLYQIVRWGISISSKNRFLYLTGVYLVIILLVILFSVSIDNLVRFLSRFLLYPFFLLYFSSSAPIKQKLGILKCFVDWIAIISWTTFLIWLMSSIGIIRPSGIFKIDWGTCVDLYNYYYLYFSSPNQYIDWIGHGVRRNIGIFAEGPMFMFVLILALLFCLIITKEYEIKKWKILGIILALISTTSITGYIFLILIICMRIVKKNKGLENKIIIGIIASIVGIIGIYIFINMKSSTASFLIRVDDYLTGLKAWASSPLIGIGYENDVLLISFMSASRLSNTGFSNTLFSVLAYGGILFVIPFLAPVIRGIYFANKKADSKVLLFSMIYLGLYFTVIFYTFYVNYLIWAFLMMIYTGNLKVET